MTSQRSAILQVHIAVLLLGGTPLFAKLITLPPETITIYRSVIGWVFLTGLMWFQKEQFALHNRREMVLMLVSGIFMAFHWATYFHAIQVSTVAVGLAAIFTFPVITVFLEPFWSRSLPHWRDVASGMLVVIGILILVPEFSLSNETALGVAWGVFSAFLYSVRNVMVRHYLNHHSGVKTMWYQFMVIVAALVFFSPLETDLATDNRIWFILLLAIGFTAIPHSLFVGSMRVLSAKSASLIACLQPLYGAIAAWVLLAEQPTWQTWVGGALIVGAAGFESFSVTQKKDD